MDLVESLRNKLTLVDGLRIAALLACVAPLAGSVIIAVLGWWQERFVKSVALIAVILSFLGGCGVLGFYSPMAETKRIYANRPMESVILAREELMILGRDQDTVRIEALWGLDGISAVLVWLTSLLTLSSVLISMRSIRERIQEYYMLLLLLAGGAMLVFLAFDVIFLYIFFELTLVPMFFLIGIWGGPERRYAARKFLIYTLAGSLIGLVALVAYVVQVRELRQAARLDVTVSRGKLERPSDRITALPDLAETAARLSRSSEQDSELREKWERLQKWTFWGLFLAFAIKVPLVPWHTWLPLAHVEAPTAGSVFLAGVLLKLGTYGFLRLVFPLLPDIVTGWGGSLLAVLAVLGIVYGSLCAAAQKDIKRLVAYSSIAHMGFCMLGMASLNTIGLAGSVLEMINHGLYTGGLFMLVGAIYERYHTRSMLDLGGLAKRLPVWAFFMVGMSLASIALPGLNGFVSETLCLAGMFYKSITLSVLGAFGIVLGAWYMMTMLRQVVFGPVRVPVRYQEEDAIQDLDMYEWMALALPMALCLALGLYPKALLDIIHPDLEGMANLYQMLRRGG
ncbi:MAG: NADH-quinone oxidoreductase subunit M [Gemmatales bacterium]|nr:NADH-quinone oxidoreductase subunit M [Gemmatales bacterium]MDW7993384.1 NADH-quinone oxidoreductase subunit M [Gemmatales bacterium]